MLSTPYDVGLLENHSKEIYVEWKIQEYFSSIPQTTGSYICSPQFCFANKEWFFQLDPNGCTDDKNVGWFGIYLMLEQDQIKETISIDFTLGIKFHEKCSQLLHYVFCTGGYGHSMLIKRDELHEKRQELVPEDTLTIVCRASISPQIEGGVWKLSEDFKNMYNNEENSDATIKVKDRLFHIHKLVLRSRSPVLSAMFQHDMKENNSNTVNIDDCDPEIFHDFLLFLYSGKTENLCPNNAGRLYILADKYILDDLKRTCVNFMEVNMNLDNICEIVILADRHHEEELKKIASEWVTNNLKTIIRTDQWVTFMAQNSVLAAELLKQAVPV